MRFRRPDFIHSFGFLVSGFGFRTFLFATPSSYWAQSLDWIGFIDSMRNVFIYLILAAVTCAVYWPVHRFSFVNYDDETYIYENKHVALGLTPGTAHWAFGSFEAANYHPLTWISFLMDSSLFGMRSGPYHIESALLHVLNALLLFGVLKAATGQKWPAAFVAAIFALHPVHVESVAWVSERKDVLSTAFLLLGTWAYLGYVRGNSSNKRMAAYVAMTICFVCGLLAKPMVVTFPFLLMLLDYWPLRRRLGWRWECVEKSPLLVLSVASCRVTYKAQSESGVVAEFRNVPLGFRLENAVVSYVRYIGKSIWPIDLSPFYPYRTDWSVGVVGGCAALMIVLMIAFIWGAKRRPYLLMGWLWFLGTLVPVIGIIQAGNQSIADRYLYLPLIGLAIMVAWAGDEISRYSRAAVVGAAIVVLIAGGVAARHQVNYWRDTRTLFEHALIVINGNAVAHVQLGYLDAREGNMAGATQHYLEAIRLNPTGFAAEFDLANLLLKTDPDVAIEHFRRAAANNPKSAKVQNNWGLALMYLHRPGEAYEHFQRAIGIDSNYPYAYSNLGTLLSESGFPDLARKEFAAALRIDPDFAEAKSGLAALSTTKP